MKLGILGGGQLAQMLIQEAEKIDQPIEWLVLSPTRENCTENWAPTRFIDPQDKEAWDIFFSEADRVTYEWENLPLELLGNIKDQEKKLFPSLSVLEVIADRGRQKTYFQKLGVPVTPFYRVSGAEKVDKALSLLGTQGVFKTCRWGYDGRGQKVIKEKKEAVSVWEEMGKQDLLYEQWIDYERELSLIATRSFQGEYSFYPLTHNFHRQGMLRWSLSPLVILEREIQEKAESYARKIGEAFQYEGTFVIEFFQIGKELLVNELASRVHNSGHWTIEGTSTSQFENHIRVGLGLSPARIQMEGFCAMLNLIGEIPPRESIVQIEKQLPNLHCHFYGKIPRANRKLGHLTVIEKSAETLKKSLEILENVLGLETPKEAI